MIRSHNEPLARPAASGGGAGERFVANAGPADPC